MVLLDSLEVRDTHSLFFESLETRGHTLTYKLAQAEDLVLEKYGEYIYDNLVYFAPTVEELATLELTSITAFVEAVSEQS